jgi:DNA polymerase III epsilon subunit-like protein
MKVLIFDTETTGLPETKIISQDTLNKWPHIVQFSFIIFDTIKKDIIETKDCIIKIPDEINISLNSTAIHGITNEMTKKGENINDVLKEFFDKLRKVDLLVGHNIDFDINMIYIELLRIIYYQENISSYKFDLHLLKNFKNIYCTMQESIDLCNIQMTSKLGKEYKKYPKLSELHEKLFGITPKNLHNSFVDILITLRCFMKLKYDTDIALESNNYKNIAIKLNIF